MKLTFFLMLSASALVLSANTVLAQDAIDLDEIIVQSEEDPTGPVVGYAAGTTASTKSGRSLLETPSSITVVTTDQIEDTAANNLSEALGYSAGVVTEAYGADPRFDSISVRGADLQNQIYLNGLHFSRSTKPDYGAPSLDIYGMERVELLRGPNSVLYGAGSPAGLVNLIQKRAQFDGDSSEAGLYFDSNGSYYIFGDANRVVNDQFSYRVVGKTGNRVLGIEDYDNPGGYLGFAAKYRPSDATTVEFLASYQNDDPDSPSGVPNALVGVYANEDLRDFYFGNEALEYGDRKTFNLGAQITHEFDNGWRVVNNTGITKLDWSYSNLSVGAVTGTEVARTQLLQDEDVISFATDLRLEGDVYMGDVFHGLTFGIDASRFEETAKSIFYYGQDPIDFSNPDYAPATAVQDGTSWAAYKNVTVKQIGIYASDELEYGNWRAGLSLRHDWNEAKGQSETLYDIPGTGAYPGYTDLSREDSATTGQASLGYVWDNGLSAYMSYGTSFQSFAEPGTDGDALDPTTGEQWELGVKYLPATIDAYLTASLYQLDEENRAVNVQNGAGVTIYDQVGKSRIRGLELEGRANLADGWSLTGGYSYTDSEIIEGDNDGNELGLTPKHTFKLWASKEFMDGTLSGLTLGAGARYIGDRYAFNANANDLEAVTLLDAAASYDFGNGTEFQLNVTNLTDEVYVSSVGYFSTYYGDGRTVSATLTKEW
ncbi:TonB-dependent siderophore receptor [Pacificibacter marinus]|uniref:Ferrichrome-iron receptor n=1 Tax=Pacificibacter marinus TaxID=658057 RepID=A0A1Y5R8A1_9RHOB|nr:TonB-dependent siderophore receptor [Pacificibacter marinus]SEK28146.1 iron complex outermembrane recepter protein [Pacificibacter marinus]SLN11408.1 Ferrichrome-iron receptor precursor [Pacificibacter marinus]